MYGAKLFGLEVKELEASETPRKSSDLCGVGSWLYCLEEKAGSRGLAH